MPQKSIKDLAANSLLRTGRGKNVIKQNLAKVKAGELNIVKKKIHDNVTWFATTTKRILVASNLFRTRTNDLEKSNQGFCCQFFTKN